MTSLLLHVQALINRATTNNHLIQEWDVGRDLRRIVVAAAVVAVLVRDLHLVGVEAGGVIIGLTTAVAAVTKKVGMAVLIVTAVIAAAAAAAVAVKVAVKVTTVVAVKVTAIVEVAVVQVAVAAVTTIITAIGVRA